MSTDDVTLWLARLYEGDPRAAGELWQQYFEKLVRLADRALQGMPRRAVDEEDVAVSAMHSFCRGMAERRFGDIRDGDHLWKLLVTITARKACAKRRNHFALKRGRGQVRGESAFQGSQQGGEPNPGIGQVIGREPTPELVCMVTENCHALLDRLGDDSLRRVALLTLEGHSTAEIADRLDCLQRTVQRKLNTIRNIWSQEAPT